MAIRSGFFDSVNDDRPYTADDLNRFLEGIISEGVFSTIPGVLRVAASTGMNVTVSPGKAWYLNTYLINTGFETLTADASDPTHPRWDRVIMKFDQNARENSFTILKGTPAASPTKPALLDTPFEKHVVLADLYIAAGVSTIGDGNIYNQVGTIETPYVRALVPNVDINDVFTQWEQQFQNFMSTQEGELADLEPLGVMEELIEIRQKQATFNLIINGDFQISERSWVAGHINNSTWLENPYTHVDRWQLIVGRSVDGTWTVNREKKEDGRWAMKVSPSTVGGYGDTWSRVAIQQFIEASRCRDLLKGTAGAKEMVLSFSYKTNVGGWYVVDLTQMVNDSANRFTSFSFIHPGNDLTVDYEWVIPADTVGSLIPNDSSAGLRLCFWLVAGDGYRTQGETVYEGVWGSMNAGYRCGSLDDYFGDSNLNYLELSNVQLEIGSVATAFRTLPYEEQLKACRRYGEGYVTKVLPGGAVLGERKHRSLWTFKEKKRAVPVITTQTTEALAHLHHNNGVYLDPSSLVQINPDPPWGFQYVDEKEQAILVFDANKDFTNEFPWLMTTFLWANSDYMLS